MHMAVDPYVCVASKLIQIGRVGGKGLHCAVSLELETHCPRTGKTGRMRYKLYDN
jgi:hypothetical protein